MPRSQLQHAQQLADRGRFDQAEEAIRRTLQDRPTDQQALRLLGRLTRQTGRVRESVAVFEQLRALRPADVQLLGELGASLTAAEQPSRALPLLAEAVDRMPGKVEWKVWLGRCFLKLFRTTAAINVLEQARKDDPREPEVLYHLANAMLIAARPAPAEPIAREYLAREPGSVRGRVLLANIWELTDRLDEAAALCREVLASDPDADAAMGTLARCLRAQGRYDDALAALGPLIVQEPSPQQALALGPVYLSLKRFEECRVLFERALAREHLPEPVRASLWLGLAEARQGLGDHEGAFDAFQRGNDLHPQDFDRAKREALYNNIRAAFSPEMLRDRPRASVDGGKCIFVVGMPRSGTSLVEQVLDAHPRVFGAGELTEIPFMVTDLCREIGSPVPGALLDATQAQLDRCGERYLARLRSIAPDAEFVVDKLPHNFEMLGFIDRVLPGAKIIHCRRDPIDTCISCYFTQLSIWHSYSNNLAHLGWAYAQYERLMAFWRDACRLPMLEVRYEEVVADLETQARRLLGHVGLAWDDRCLRYYETRRAVTTASVDQVRRPIYTSSVARWKQYRNRIGPLLESLRAGGVELPGV